MQIISIYAKFLQGFKNILVNCFFLSINYIKIYSSCSLSISIYWLMELNILTDFPAISINFHIFLCDFHDHFTKNTNTNLFPQSCPIGVIVENCQVPFPLPLASSTSHSTKHLFIKQLHSIQFVHALRSLRIVLDRIIENPLDGWQWNCLFLFGTSLYRVWNGIRGRKLRL